MEKTLLVFCLLLAIATLVLSGIAGDNGGQLYGSARSIHGWMDKRLQYAGIYDRGYDSTDYRIGWASKGMMLP